MGCLLAGWQTRLGGPWSCLFQEDGHLLPGLSPGGTLLCPPPRRSAESPAPRPRSWPPPWLRRGSGADAAMLRESLRVRGPSLGKHDGDPSKRIKLVTRAVFLSKKGVRGLRATIAAPGPFNLNLRPLCLLSHSLYFWAYNSNFSPSLHWERKIENFPSPTP